MSSKIELVKLVQRARRSGGDKYESDDGRFTIYVPQYISRPAGQPEPVEKLKVIFEY